MRQWVWKWEDYFDLSYFFYLHCQIKNICFCLFPDPAVKDKLRWWIILSGYHWGVKITSKKPPNQNSRCTLPRVAVQETSREIPEKTEKTELIEERNLNHTGKFISSWSKTTVLGIKSTENWAANSPVCVSGIN